jgi:hypothetical protein
LKRIKEGIKQRREDSVSGRDQREEDDTDKGPHLSARERKEKGVPVRAGKWAAASARPRWAVVPFFFDLSFFSLFIFCSLISFITFAFQIQTRSNQMQKFSKIKNNISKQ